MTHKRSLKIPLFSLLACIGFLLPPIAHAVPVLVCSADKLIVYSDDVVRIRLLAAESATIPTAVEWVVQAGRITQVGEFWQWNLADTAPGVYEATLKSTTAAKKRDLCQLKVIVRLPPLKLKGVARVTAQSLLQPDEDEAQGYGLYSYLLFANKPDESSRERYLKAIEEFLKFPEVSEIEKYMSQDENTSMEEVRSRINLTYIPLTAAPDAKILQEWSDGAYEKVSQWVLRHYDYARAQVIIYRVQRQLYGGPYVVSILQPQRRAKNVTKYLFQDQSRVPTHLIASWMKEFLYQAAQEDYWEERATKMLVLKLRSIVGVLAIGLPQVQRAVDDLVKWVDKS